MNDNDYILILMKFLKEEGLYNEFFKELHKYCAKSITEIGDIWYYWKNIHSIVAKVLTNNTRKQYPCGWSFYLDETERGYDFWHKVDLKFSSIFKQALNAIGTINSRKEKENVVG